MRNITLLETLRPWAIAGVTHLLVEENDQLTAEAVVHAGLASGEDASLEMAVSKKSILFSEVKPPAPASSMPVLPTAPAYDVWPSEWKDRFEKTPLAPVVWCYSLLGLDLSGAGSVERSSCLRSIIGKLGLPKGSSSFWPCSLPDEKGEMYKREELFRGGLNLLNPKAIVFIGDELVESVSPELTLNIPYTQQVYRGCLYTLLPDFSCLQNDPSQIARVCSYLKSAFSGVAVLHLT